MSFIKKLQKTTWIDWIKMLVAIDIASAGVGLVFNIPFHVFANAFGFVSKIIFGIMYIFVALLIFKRISLSDTKNEKEDEIKESNLDNDIRQGIESAKNITKKLVKKIQEGSENLLNTIDKKIDRAEIFFKKRIREAKKETKELIDKK